MRAIPFENLDPLLGRRVSLDLDSLQDKLVRRRRGGYCFEHATLFQAVLRDLGFTVTSHLARVVLSGPKTQSSRTHMFNLIHLPEGTFVADPGFGGPAAISPLELAETPRDPAGHWFGRDDDGDWVLRGAPGDLWVTELTTDYPIDFELPNHYVATHPSSIFTSTLMLNRFTEEGRVSLMNRDATVRKAGEVKSWQLENRQELVSFLVEYLGVDVPEAEKLRVPAIAGWV
jgi:N-hydroxyarylamine O-acetyltransferase